MRIIAINGSPRKQGNTSNIVRAMLEGAASAGAETTEVRLHDIDLKGCMGCLSCRQNPGICKQQDDLSPYLEALKSGESYKPSPKKIAEKKSRKAESFKSSKVSRKLSKKHYHTVNSGESLWSISRRYGLTVKNIRILNKLNNKSEIYPGQKLLVTL